MMKNKFFFFMMVLAMAFWAGSWISAKVISSAVDPRLVIFWRFTITFATFLPVLFVRRKSIPLPTRDAVFYTIAAAVCICFYNYLFISGLRGSLAGKAGVIVTTVNPLFTFALSSLLFRQKALVFQKFALALGLAGGFILTEPWTWQSGALSDMNNLVFIVSAFCWSALTLLSQRAQTKMHPLWYNCLLYFTAAVFIGLIIPAELWSATEAIDAAGWFNIAYLAIFAGSLGAGIYFLSARKLGASQASTMTFLVPVLALFMGWAFLGEKAEWTTIAGGFLSILAVLIINERIRIPRFQTSD